MKELDGGGKSLVRIHVAKLSMEQFFSVNISLRLNRKSRKRFNRFGIA